MLASSTKGPTILYFDKSLSKNKINETITKNKKKRRRGKGGRSKRVTTETLLWTDVATVYYNRDTPVSFASIMRGKSKKCIVYPASSTTDNYIELLGMLFEEREYFAIPEGNLKEFTDLGAQF